MRPQPWFAASAWNMVEQRPLEGFVFAVTPFNFASIAGVHFTGSTATLRGIWKTIGENIDRYKCYPRLIGESGGKDFIFAHVSADEAALVSGLLRGAFEYQGQKCSAASRASGTNDKAGNAINLQRWVSPRSIKENFCPPTDFRYSFMKEK